MINLVYLSSVQIVLTLVDLICDLSFLHIPNLVAQFVMIYILVLISKLPNIPTVTGQGSRTLFLQIRIVHSSPDTDMRVVVANGLMHWVSGSHIQRDHPPSEVAWTRAPLAR
jgi:hypothetical protein